MINWKVRIKNPTFWITAIPALLVIIEILMSIFGITIDLGELGNKLKALVEAVFLFLGILGIVNDPTTAGIRDSARAMTYSKPKE